MERKKKQNGWDVIRHYFKKIVYFGWDELTLSGILIAISVRGLVLVWIWSGFNTYVLPLIPKTVDSETPVTSPQPAAIIKAFEENNQILRQGGSERYVFINTWSEKKSGSYQGHQDGAISVTEGETVSRFDYDGKVPVRSNFGFSFVSEGVFGPNVAIARPEFWEVTVGDKSDTVITLKATSKLGGNLEPVEETSWKKLRPESNALRPRAESCRFNPGEEVKVEISETFLSDSKQFKVDVTVSCNDMSTDTLSWLFTPPPKWTELEGIYLAILDLDGENQTKIHFINPPVLELLSQQ